MSQKNIRTDPPILDRDDPYKSAQAFDDYRTSLYNGRDGRILYRDEFYWVQPLEKISDAEIKAMIWEFLSLSKLDDGNGITIDFRPKRRDIAELFEALKAYLFDTEFEVLNELNATTPAAMTKGTEQKDSGVSTQREH